MRFLRILKREIVWKGDFLLGIRVTYLNQDYKEKIWEFIERKNPDTVSIVLYEKEKKEFILIEQPRLAVNGDVVGLVAGICDVNGEPMEDTVVREAIEESGWRPQYVLRISKSNVVSAGLGNERRTIYYGTDLKFVGKKKGPEEDRITVHSIPRDRIFEWLSRQDSQGKIVEANVAGDIALALRLIEEEEKQKKQ